MTDMTFLLTPPPRGLGLDLEDRSLIETLKRYPEAFTEETVEHFLKCRVVTAMAGKIFAVRATSLPNVVRAVSRFLYLCNSHTRKHWDEFRGSGMLEEFMTRMGVVVGEGRYLLGEDLLQAFLPLLYVGEGMTSDGDGIDHCGAHVLSQVTEGFRTPLHAPSSHQHAQSQPPAQGITCENGRQGPLVKNKYVYTALVMAFHKIASFPAHVNNEVDPGCIAYCATFLDALMQVICSPGNMRPIMLAHPLIPVLEDIGRLPPDITNKICTWVAFLCTFHRIAPLVELCALVEAAGVVFERASTGHGVALEEGEEREAKEKQGGEGADGFARKGREAHSFRVFNLVCSLRHLVVATVRADPRYKQVWCDTGLIETLMIVIRPASRPAAAVIPPRTQDACHISGMESSSGAGGAPGKAFASFTVSLALDTLLWVVRGCGKAARLVVDNGAAPTILALLAQDTHYAEGVCLWNVLMREMAVAMTSPPRNWSAGSGSPPPPTPCSLPPTPLASSRDLHGDMNGKVAEESTDRSGKEFEALLKVLLDDFDERFISCQAVSELPPASAETSTNGASEEVVRMLEAPFGNGGMIAMAYVRALTATAEVPYQARNWSETVGLHPPLALDASGKALQQCILVVHAVLSLLVPPDTLGGVWERRLGTPSPCVGSQGEVAAHGLLETGYDGFPFVTPIVLASIRRHRGQALRWLALTPPVSPGLAQAFSRVLQIRCAMVRAGGVDRILRMVEQCIARMETGEWPFQSLCLGPDRRLAFGPFVGPGQDKDSYASGGNSQVGLANDENTAFAEFLGSCLLVFVTALSRLHPVDSVEGVTVEVGGRKSFDTHMLVGGAASVTSMRHSLALFQELGSLCARLVRGTFPALILPEASSCSYSESSRIPHSILAFLGRFLLSMALGGYTPVLEAILAPRPAHSLSTIPAPSLCPLLSTSPPLSSSFHGPDAPPGDLFPAAGGAPTVSDRNEYMVPFSASHPPLHSPRAILLLLELVAEYPVNLPGCAFAGPLFEALAGFVARLLASEKNLELALEAGLVRTALWAAMQPAAFQENVESCLLSLLGLAARERTSGEDLRTWFNAVLTDYDGVIPGEVGAAEGNEGRDGRKKRNERMETRRLNLLRVLVDVTRGVSVPAPLPEARKKASIRAPASPSTNSSPCLDSPHSPCCTDMAFLSHPTGHTFGSAALVVFDPSPVCAQGGTGTDGSGGGPRLAIPSLHPEGFAEAIRQEEGSGGEGKVHPWPPPTGYTFAVWFRLGRPATLRLPLLLLAEDGKLLTSIEIVNNRLTVSSAPAGREGVQEAVCDRLPPFFACTWYHLTVVHEKRRPAQAAVYLNGDFAQALPLAYPRPTKGLHRVQCCMGQGPGNGRGACPLTWQQQQPLRGSPPSHQQQRVKQPQQQPPDDCNRMKWTLGPVYLLSECISDLAVLMLYATGPSSVLTFLGDDGRGAFPLCYDLCSAAQLRVLIKAHKVGGHVSAGSRGARGGEREEAEGSKEGRKGLRGSFSGMDGSHGGGKSIGTGGMQGIGTGEAKVSVLSRAQFTNLSAAPVDVLGIAADHVILSLAPRTVSEDPCNLSRLSAYSALCNRESLAVELSGGALAVDRRRVADSLQYACQSPLVPAIMLCERAQSVEELRLALEFLVALLHAQPLNIQRVERGHFYAILSELLRRKARRGLIVPQSMEPLLLLVGKTSFSQDHRPGEWMLTVINLQALQHLVFNFSIWKDASPEVHCLVLGTLRHAIAASGSEEHDGRRAVEELNLRRFQFAGITRSLLYMLIQPDTSQELFMSMCNLIYDILTRKRPPIDDLAAVAHVILATCSIRFQRLYMNGLLTTSRAKAAHSERGGSGSVGGTAKVSDVQDPKASDPAHRHPKKPHALHRTTISRAHRLKSIRRGLLRLLIRVTEHYALHSSHGARNGGMRADGKVPGGDFRPGVNGCAHSSTGSFTPVASDACLGLIVRAMPPKWLVYIAYLFGDVVFWAGIAQGKIDLEDGLPFTPFERDVHSSVFPVYESNGLREEKGMNGRLPTSRRISTSISTMGGFKRAARRHQDPLSALLAYQLLVALMPSAQAIVDRMAGLGHLQVILPSMFKALELHALGIPVPLPASKSSFSTTAIENTGQASCGRYLSHGPGSFADDDLSQAWQPQLVPKEVAEVKAFFHLPASDKGTCEPPPVYLQCLRTLYKTQFSHLLGSSALFLALEQIFDHLAVGTRRSLSSSGSAVWGGEPSLLLPHQTIQVPGTLPAILSSISAAAGMTTVQGLLQTIEARPTALTDSKLSHVVLLLREETSRKCNNKCSYNSNTNGNNEDSNKCRDKYAHSPLYDVLQERCHAAHVVSYKALTFLYNLYLESVELRELFRGDFSSNVVVSGVSGGVTARLGGLLLPKGEDLVEEMAQVYYAVLLAEMLEDPRKADEASCGSGRVAEAVKEDEQEQGSNPITPGMQPPSSERDVLKHPGSLRRLTLKFLVALLFDRLAHQAKAVSSIQSCLQAWPRDLHLYPWPSLHGANPPHQRDDDDKGPAPLAGQFGEALQSHFQSTLLHALLSEVRIRLQDNSGQHDSGPALLYPSHSRLSGNLPRFFALVASNIFLAEKNGAHLLSSKFPRTPILSCQPGQAKSLNRDYWLLTNLQFLVDMLQFGVIPSPVSATEPVLGVTFRSLKVVQQQQQQYHQHQHSQRQHTASPPAYKTTATVSLLGGQAKHAVGNLFGIAKWKGDDVEEWILCALDFLRKVLLFGLGWLDNGLQESTVSAVFKHALRHFNFLLPQLQTPRAIEQDKQFLAALLHYLYPLLSDEKAHYREAAMYLWRELLASSRLRKVMEGLLSVPHLVTVQGKKGEVLEKNASLNLLNGSVGGGPSFPFQAPSPCSEGFDILLKVDLSHFPSLRPFLDSTSSSASFPTPLGARPRSRSVKSTVVTAGNEFADKEFYSWLGSLSSDLQGKIHKSLLQHGREFRQWAVSTADVVVQAHQDGVATTEKHRRKAAFARLKALTKASSAWRKELKPRQDLELRRQVRWSQERTDREAFGARHMQVLFTELMEGMSLATRAEGSFITDRAVSPSRGRWRQNEPAAEEVRMERWLQSLILHVGDAALLGGMENGVGDGDYCVESAEGPMRMRRRLLRAPYRLGPVARNLAASSSASPRPGVTPIPEPKRPQMRRQRSQSLPALPKRSVTFDRGSPVGALTVQGGLNASPSMDSESDDIPLPRGSPILRPCRNLPVSSPLSLTYEADQSEESPGCVVGSSEEVLPSNTLLEKGAADMDFFLDDYVETDEDTEATEDEEDEEDEEEEEEEKEDGEEAGEEEIKVVEQMEREEGKEGADVTSSGLNSKRREESDGQAAKHTRPPAFTVVGMTRSMEERLRPFGSHDDLTSRPATSPKQSFGAPGTETGTGEGDHLDRLPSIIHPFRRRTLASAAEMAGAEHGERETTEGVSPRMALDREIGGGNEMEGEDLEAAEDLVGADGKLKPFLVPGDEIKHRYNCARIQGVYCYPGLTLLARNHLYIIDNYKLIETGALAGQEKGQANLTSPYEVAEIEPEKATTIQTPHSLENEHGTTDSSPSVPVLCTHRVEISPRLRAKCVPGGALGPPHRCHYFPFEDVTVVYRRRYHLRHVALEIFLANGENHLITLEAPEARNNLLQKLKARCKEAIAAVESARVSPLDEIQTFLSLTTPSTWTERWVRGDISNFQYLMHLNTHSGRSYNDLTQYPVFPWIVADWDSPKLDLTNPNTFRDLSRPMGALNPAREMEFRERYALLKEAEQPGDPKKAFHYGTHYSSAAIVLYYLVRLQPFAEQHVRLQSGRFDHSDRLFSALKKSWCASSGAAEGRESGASTNTQDVRELIPEFFYLPEMFTNRNGYDYGKDSEGTHIDHVVLPPWAGGSAQEFVRLHRQALESEHVSRHLHHWIDLIWGYKQRGKAAEEACNVYYYLTYEGAMDLETVEDPSLRAAYVEQIHEFGQTPSQLFKTPHPARIHVASGGNTHEREGFPGNSTGNGGAGGGLGGGSTPQWLRNLKPTRSGGRPGPSPLPPSINTQLSFDDGPRGIGATACLTGQPERILSGTGGMTDAEPSKTFAIREAETSHSILKPYPWTLSFLSHWTKAEVPCLHTSEAALNRWPPRRLTVGTSAPVVHWIQHNSPLDPFHRVFDPVGHFVVGQILPPPPSSSPSPLSAPLALHKACAYIPETERFLAWGYADNCLRVGALAPNAALHASNPINSGLSGFAKGNAGVGVSSLAERRLSLALDSAGPIAALAVGEDGRTMVTGSRLLPVVTVWGMAKGLVSAAEGTALPRMITRMGALLSALHAGGITNVALSAKYSVVVSVCALHRAVLLWDLNRRRLLRRLLVIFPETWEGQNGKEPVTLCIADVTGTILLTMGTSIQVYNVNGDPLARLDLRTVPVRGGFAGQRSPFSSLSTPASPCIGTAQATTSTQNLLHAPAALITASCVVGDGSMPVTLATGHQDGRLRLWVVALEREVEGGRSPPMAVDMGQWQGGGANRLHLVGEFENDLHRPHARVGRVPVTALTLTRDARCLYAGDAVGRVCVWTASSTSTLAAMEGGTPSSRSQGIR